MLAWISAVAGAFVLVVAAFSAWLTWSVGRDHPPTGQIVEIDGQRLNVLSAGPDQAPAIVMLHGASANALDLWSVLAPNLSADYRIIAIDRPGHGHSDRGAQTAMASPAAQAQLAGDLLTQLEIDKALVVAHSYAGVVALNLTLEQPSKVAGLVLLAPVSHPWPGGIAWYHHVIATPIVGPLFTWLVAVPFGHLTIDGAVREVFATDPVPEDFDARTAVGLALRPCAIRANAFDLTRLYDFVVDQVDRLPEIDRPATVISGADDTTVWPSIHSAGLERDIGARLVMRPGGHSPHHAATDLVVSEVRALAERVFVADGEAMGEDRR